MARQGTDRSTFALRERGVIVRVSAATLATVNSVLLVVALIDPSTFGLSTTMVLTLGLPHVLLEVVIAALPWQRLLPAHPRPWLLRGHVLLNLVGLLVALLLSEGSSAEALWLIGLLLVYSALILPLEEHLAIAGTAIAGAAVTTIAAEGATLSLLVRLTAMTGIGALAAVASHVVWNSLLRAERARREADESGAALHDALLAVHSTSSGDVQRILDSTVAAAVRGVDDMAAAYLLDDDRPMTAFRNVPPAMQVRDTTGIRSIVADIDAHGSGVLDYHGEDAELLPPHLRGVLRASIVAPIRHRGHIIGAVTVARTRGQLFSTGERVAIELLADHVARGAALSHELEADREALERLRELDRMKRDFVATVSHEMRTPLTVISGLAEILDLRGDALDGELRRQLVDRLRSNAATLERIVTGLLDAAGIDRGLVPVRADDIDISGLLRDTADRLVPLFEQHVLDVEVADGLHCSGDESLLERVLENLLTNAERHTPAGTTVCLRGRSTPTGVVVQVADDGPGIPPDELESVLGRFVRGGHPNDRPTRGLGLGLALADEVLRLHGTHLQIDSTLGEGTTFGFELAVVPSPAVSG